MLSIYEVHGIIYKIRKNTCKTGGAIMQRCKKILAVALALLLIVGCLPTIALASERSDETAIYTQTFGGDQLPTGWNAQVHGDTLKPWSVSNGKLVAQWTTDENGIPANSYCCYSTEQTMLWSGYAAQADITLYKQDNGSFPSVALCTYILPETGKRFEVRIGVASETSFNVGLYTRSAASGFSVEMEKYTPSGKISGYDEKNGKVSFHLKVDMSGGEINVYIDGAKVWERGYSLASEKILTGGGVGFFAMRTGKNAGKVRLEMDNLTVTLPKEDSGLESVDVDFYNPTNWDISADANPVIRDDTITMIIDGTVKPNAAAAFVLPEAEHWSNYRFSADITVPKTASGKYAQAGIRANGMATSAEAQAKSCYEFRVIPKEDGFGVTLYKLYTNNAGKRVPQLMIEDTYLPLSGNPYGNESICYNGAIQMLDGVITCYVNNELVLTYDTAKEDSSWGMAFGKGSIGLFIARADKKDSDTKAVYANLKLEKAASTPGGEEGDNRNPAITNSDGMLAVYTDTFDDYKKGSLGTWNGGEANWQIKNGTLMISDDRTSVSTYLLSDKKLHAFGGVQGDVMLTSRLNGSDLYAGLVAAYDGENYYYLRLADMKSGSSQFQLYRMEDGKATKLQSVMLDSDLQRNVWYRLKLTMTDSVIRGYLDGKLYIEHDTKDDAAVYTFGSAGFRSIKGSAAYDNFSILLPRETPVIREEFDGVANLKDTFWTDKTDDWSVVDGKLLQNEDEQMGTFMQLYDNGQKLASGGAGMDVMFTSKNSGDLYAGPVVGYNGSKNYYHLQLADRKDGVDLLQLYRTDDGKANLLESVSLPFAIQRNVWYHVELYLHDGVFYGYLDGALYLTYTPTEGIRYPAGLVGIQVSQGSAAIDHFTAYGPAEGIKQEITYNNTVVKDPVVFQDGFEEETVGKNPDYWLQDNENKTWFVYNQKGSRVYGVNNSKTVSHTWLHVFETNVDYSAKLYVPTGGVTEVSKAGITLRHTGIYTEAWVQIGYDFALGKWYARDLKGADFEAVMHYAHETSKFPLDQWNTVRAYAVGNQLQFYFNGELVLQTDVEQVTTGRVGLFTEKTELYADDIQLKLLSGQGRVEKAVLENYVIDRHKFTEGASIFEYSENFWIMNYNSELFISEDHGSTFRKATEAEKKTYAFFAQSTRTQYIRLHNGYILKVDNFTGGKAYLSKDNGATYQQVGAMWDMKDFPYCKYDRFGGMNDMIKEVQLADGSYRVFYCGDVRSYGGPDAVGSIDWHWEEVYYTDDFGYTWHRSEIDTRAISALPHICESRIIACSDGTLRMYCTWNKTNSGKSSDSLRYFISYDNGVTWEGEYAIPQIANPCSSLAVDRDTDGTHYMICVYAEKYRTRLALFRTADGKNWEYLMDCWRWEDAPGDRFNKINQVVDPSITVTEDYIMVTSGWSEKESTGHNEQRQHVLKIAKSELKPYEQWPNFEDYTDPKDIIYIEAVDIPKEHLVGEKLNIEDAYLLVHHLDGTTSKVPMSDSGVVIEEVIENYNLWTNEMPAPDMSKLGKKMLRIRYKLFGCNAHIEVVTEHIHKLDFVEATSSTCTKEGNSAYWNCAGCGKAFADAEALTEIKKNSCNLPILPHDFTKYESDGNATCTADGTKTAKCTYCDAADTVTDKDSAGHSLVEKKEIPATKESAGVKAHWLCQRCNKYYADAEGRAETTVEELTIPQLNDTPQTDDAPQTDDIPQVDDMPQGNDHKTILVIVAGIIAVAVVVTALVITKKRFF